MLGRGWEDGKARIVARKTHEGIYHLQGPGGLYHSTYDYVVDVQPDSGAPTFRASLTELFHTDEREPDVGDWARVKFRPKDNAVKFDRSAIANAATATKEASRARWDALASGEPGSGRADAPKQAASMRDEVGDRAAAASSGSDAKRAPSLKEIMKARSDPDAAAELKRRVVADASSAQAESEHSIEARLGKLQELRDQGVLTPEEYAAQRQRILDSV